MQKPLSASFQKLRRAQRLLIRRKRRSKVRVSFTHSSGSRNSTGKTATAKASTSQLRPNRPERIPDAVPVAWQPEEADIRNSVKNLNDNGPYPLFPKSATSTSQENDRCLGSPSRRVCGQGSKDVEHGARQAVNHTPTRSPSKPDARAAQQRLGSKDAGVENTREIPQGGRKNQEAQATSKQRPAPLPPGPQYSIFPKQSYRRSQASDRKSIPPGPSHSESVRRSLSQQRQLAALIPPETQGTSARPNPPYQACPQTPVALEPEESLASTAKRKFRPMSLKQLRVLDKFARELEEFAKTTEGPGKVLELVPTPTPSEAHASVRTVQELLPYREQFQQAGLAVTSADQKSPLKREKSLPPQPRSSADDRLRFDGPGASTQGTSTTKGSSSDTAVQLSEPDPLTPTLSGDPSRNNTDIRLHNTVSPGSPPPESLPSTSSAEVNNVIVVEQKASRPRPSAVFLMNKPLPARPGSFGPKPPERKRVSTKEPPSVGQTVATRKAFLVPRPERDLPQIPFKGPSTNIIPHRQMSFQSTKELIETRKSDKALPALPVARLPSQIRHGLGFPGQPSWAPAARQLPTTIVEEKEPSPEKQKISIHRTFPLRPKDTNTLLVAKAGKEETSDRQPDTIKSTTPDLHRKPEPLPETWKHVIGTPSSFKKALDDVVRKLEDMEDNKSTTAEAAANPPSQPRRTTTAASSSSKVPSPSQRLERAAAMRRQRMTGQNIEPVERLKTPAPATVRAPSRPIVRSRSSGRKPNSTAVKTQSEEENLLPPAHDDKDISDRDVLKGLKIICAASADHDFDAWIQSKTGLRLRRFLADLKTFENLTEDGILAVGDQRARRRRSERRRRQAERERGGQGR